MRDLNALLEEALQLPEEERIALADALLGSVEEPEPLVPGETFAETIQRRIDELESGAVRAIPWEEARRTIFES
jgi:putative addiction module component (TIGR02574 family)